MIALGLLIYKFYGEYDKKNWKSASSLFDEDMCWVSGVYFFGSPCIWLLGPWGLSQTHIGAERAPGPGARRGLWGLVSPVHVYPLTMVWTLYHPTFWHCWHWSLPFHVLCDRNSVCLSHSLVDCVHMVQPTIMISSLYGIGSPSFF